MNTRAREADPAADHRTLRQKLADMAAQSDSPEEARIAAAKLATLPASKTLTRAAILGTPNDDRPSGARRVWDRSRRAYVVVDVADLVARAFPVPLDVDDDWDGVE